MNALNATIVERLKPLWVGLNRFGWLLLLLAMAWLCWALARFVWLLLAPPLPPALPELPWQAPMTAQSDYSSAFGVFESPALSEVASQPPPNIVVKGVLLAEPERYSSALLEIDGVVKNYRIGVALGDSDYRLVAVDWNEVVIADGQDNQMLLSLVQPMSLDQGGLYDEQSNISNQRLPSVDNANHEGYEPYADQYGYDSPSDGGAAQSSPSPLEEAVSELQQNPDVYLSRMGVMATGDGYQVTDAMPAEVKERLGLEIGDRVLSVNGQAVGANPAQDASLLQQIQQSGEAQIQVQRGEQVFTIRQQF